MSGQIAPRAWQRWGVRWRSTGQLDGETTHIIGHLGIPALFRTRREAREWAEKHYGYIKDRSDLRAAPHGWRMPEPVRVTISVGETA